MRTLKQFWHWHCESNESPAVVQSHMMSAWLSIVVHWALAIVGKAVITRFLMLEEMAAISELFYFAATLATGLSILWCVFVLAAVMANSRRKSRQHEDS